MNYSYDEQNKTLTLDGSGTIILSKNDIGMKIGGELSTTDDLKIKILNHHIVGFNSRSFKSKLISTKQLLKFIWMKR